jgi:hypothetical protein
VLAALMVLGIRPPGRQAPQPPATV